MGGQHSRSWKVWLGPLGVGLLRAGILVRRQRQPAPQDAQIEELQDRWMAELGSAAVHHLLPTPVGRVHVIEVGTGPEVVVFLNGLATSSGEYAALLAELALRYRVPAIDRPGCGLSDPVSFSGHPRTAWNRVMASVADQLGLQSFGIVGHSLEGLAAGAFAIHAPERVR